MRTSELLQAMASWLESPNNEAMLLAEHDESCLKVVAESCTLAAALLKNAAEEVDVLEPQEPSNITPDSIQGLANLATAFDASGDPELKKQASVLDELLLTVCAKPGELAEKLAAADRRLEDLRKKYQGNTETLREIGRVEESEKAIKKSKMTEEVKINDQPLSSRSCPDHHGAQLQRLGDHVWQCDLDKKIYDYEAGFTLESGKKVPGGDVSLQTANSLAVNTHALFDSREGRLQSNKA